MRVEKNQQKVLIIKMGYSETLDPKISYSSSYGDVLRTTVLLHLYRKDHVTWLVDEKAYPILRYNDLIERILVYNLSSVLQLESEEFDTVINLEKVPGLCALAEKIKAWRRYGFRFDSRLGEAAAYDGSHIVLDMCKNLELKRKREAFWQEGLFEMVGAKWKGEEYILGYKPSSNPEFDIGFNFKIGEKWPIKAWPSDNWKKLELLLKSYYKISWQQGLDNMEEYFEWINSCRLIVSNDSFGMHLAIALKKKIIGLFGPTNHKENYFYNLGKYLWPGEKMNCGLYPCHGEKCNLFEKTCMSLISPEMVENTVIKLLKKS
jgi:heptosyltransferase-2